MAGNAYGEDPPRLVISGAVAASIPCAFCGYDLRGLAAQGVCAECGGKVSYSVPMPALLEAGDRTLDALEMGGTLAVVGSVMITAAPAGMAAAWLASMHPSVSMDFAEAVLVLCGAALLGLVLQVIATWMICEAKVDDAAAGVGVGEPAGRIGGRALLAAMVVAFGVLAYEVVGVAAAALLVAIVSWCMLERIAGLAGLIPDRRLSIWGRWLPMIQGGVAIFAFVAIFGRLGEWAGAASLILIFAAVAAQGLAAARFRRGIRRARVCLRGAAGTPTGQTPPGGEQSA